MATDERWNHNIHYHSVVLAALPPRCDRVLEVGCGEGFLTRELSAVARQVIAIDKDATTVELAQQNAPAVNITYVLDDFLAHPFEPASFDAVVSIATIHHMSTSAALYKMRQLVRPGGTVALIGLARSRRPSDFLFDIAGVIGTRIYTTAKTVYEGNAPKVWPPPETYGQTRQVADAVLPGVRYRRRMFFRYSLLWTKPGPHLLAS